MKTIAQHLNIKEFPFMINDKQGKEIYYEDSEGYWNKREYDEKGNEIYFEDGEGYWIKREYDKQGNEIYYENSLGYWIKREYDKQGTKIYCENIYRKIIDNRKVESQFNKLPKQVVEILYNDYKTKDIYQESIRIKKELKQIGWSVDYDLVGEIHLLIKD